MKGKEVSGVVEAVSVEKGGIRFGEDWYNADENCKKYVHAGLKGKSVQITLSEGNRFSFIRETDKPSEQIKDTDAQTAVTAAGSAEDKETKLPEGLSKEHIVMVKGKPFIKYSGLLDMATKKGLKELSVQEHFVDWEKGFAHCVVRAISEEIEGQHIIQKIFDGFGSAHPKNVSEQMRVYFVEMAHTRAKARALRDLLNVSVVSVEELESLGDAK